jgi:hypothetical protein
MTKEYQQFSNAAPKLTDKDYEFVRDDRGNVSHLVVHGYKFTGYELLKHIIEVTDKNRVESLWQVMHSISHVFYSVNDETFNKLYRTAAAHLIALENTKELKSATDDPLKNNVIAFVGTRTAVGGGKKYSTGKSAMGKVYKIGTGKKKKMRVL